jgi:hypothetical protein
LIRRETLKTGTTGKPNVGKSYLKATPPESDEFDGSKLGLQWQWHANYQTYWGFASGNLGFFRLNCIPRPTNAVNLWDVSNMLLQKFPAPDKYKNRSKSNVYCGSHIFDNGF